MFDLSLYEFSTQQVAASLIYLQAGFSQGVFSQKQLFSFTCELKREALLTEYYPNFSELVVGFINDEMGIFFDDLTNCILYLVKFYEFKLTEKMPIATTKKKMVSSLISGTHRGFVQSLDFHSRRNSVL